MRFYRNTGYLKMPWTLPQTVVDRILGKLNAELNNSPYPCKRSDSGEILKLYDLVNRDAIFVKALLNEGILTPLKSLLGPNIELCLNRHNQAVILTKTNSEIRYHRDIQHWSRPNISVLIYLQETSIENGCTHIIPGSDRFSYPPPSQDPSHGGTWLSELKDESVYKAQGVPIPMPKGGILFCNSLMFHSAGINSTTDARFIVTYACHASDEIQKETDYKKLLCGERIYKGNTLVWSE